MTDNGVQFTSREFKQLLQRYAIHVLTASHSPQANASERVNRSILSGIRAYVNADQTTWDEHLSSVASSLRNSSHSATGQTPFYMVFGQQMIQHAGSYALLRQLQSLPHGDITIVPPRKHREVLKKQVRERLAFARARNAQKYNTRTREVNFRPEQEVFIRSFRQSDFAKNFNAKLAR